MNRRIVRLAIAFFVVLSSTANAQELLLFGGNGHDVFLVASIVTNTDRNRSVTNSGLVVPSKATVSSMNLVSLGVSSHPQAHGMHLAVQIAYLYWLIIKADSMAILLSTSSARMQWISRVIWRRCMK